MGTTPVVIVEFHGNARLVETPEHEVMSIGWMIGRQVNFFRPMKIIRKFEFKDEADRAWKDLRAGATDAEILSRDYSGVPPIGEPIPLVDHSRMKARR
jgi:hypothetical protein